MAAPVRWNPDPRLRAMERAAQTPDELAAYAAARRRAGETVDPWELIPVSYVFLQAYHEFARYYKPGGLRQAGEGIPRVTGRVEAYRDPAFFVKFRASTGTLRCGYARCRVPASWRRGDGKVTCGNHPADRRYLKQGGKKLPLGSGGSPQRFYVVPNPYPLLAPPQAPFWGPVVKEDEIRWHLEAIEEWRGLGAIVVELDFSEALQKHAPDCGKGGHADGMGGCSYCTWIDAYKWRVLTQVQDVRNALGQSGWWGGRGVDVLIPAQWDWARIMKRKGKAWKNNPLPADVMALGHALLEYAEEEGSQRVGEIVWTKDADDPYERLESLTGKPSPLPGPGPGFHVESHTIGCRYAVSGDYESPGFCWEDPRLLWQEHFEIYAELKAKKRVVLLGDPERGVFVSITPSVGS